MLVSPEEVWVPPEGWPEESPLLKGTLNSYVTIRLRHTTLTPKYRTYVEAAQATKQVYHLRSLQEVKDFWGAIAPH